MSDEIVNRVANSQLMTIDLEDYYPEGERKYFDLKDWLYEGLVLREKEFRFLVKEHDWSQYEGSYVALQCSSDAIVPAWAYMLINIHLEPFVKRAIIGNSTDLETALYQDLINAIDITPYQNKPVIIKGCSNKPVPPNAYIMISNRLKPIVKSIMYGEACSSVPLFKSGTKKI